MFSPIKELRSTAVETAGVFKLPRDLAESRRWRMYLAGFQQTTGSPTSGFLTKFILYYERERLVQEQKELGGTINPAHQWPSGSGGELVVLYLAWKYSGSLSDHRNHRGPYIGTRRLHFFYSSPTPIMRHLPTDIFATNVAAIFKMAKRPLPPFPLQEFTLQIGFATPYKYNLFGWSNHRIIARKSKSHDVFMKEIFVQNDGDAPKEGAELVSTLAPSEDMENKPIFVGDKEIDLNKIFTPAPDADQYIIKKDKKFEKYSIAYTTESAVKSYLTSFLSLNFVNVPLAGNTIGTILMAGVLLTYASCTIFCHIRWGSEMMYRQRYPPRILSRGLQEKSLFLFKDGNVLMTALELRVSMGFGDHRLSHGSNARLPLINYIYLSKR
ncbi:hypothetical protein EVAR_29160_1 [Eumeta japonica]|uniref:Uncharacterized protein n=1 Tax=Eumeta variegata TaxID=151549 RepID=A0A4C1VBX7_EUMVA|nr:hypothetical protein EVAR_29160_1 [Eumeta japonica]